MKTILITGGTGLIGKKLIPKLIEQGYVVHVLSRKIKSANGNLKFFVWNTDKNEIDEACFENISGIIHLAGEGIAEKRWTDKRKQEIVCSRVDSAKLLLNKVKEKKLQLDFFISASAVGYYGAITNEKIYTETDSPYNDFISECTVKWEQIADAFQANAQRIAKIRIGIVLDKNEGALPKMLQTIRYGIGSAFGSGKQYMPWIHIDDLVSVFVKAVSEHNYNGVYNAVSPEHIDNKNFTKVCAKTLKKPLFMPNVPSFILKFVLGEMSCLVLEGSRVSSEKLKQQGFVFQYSNLEKALQNLLEE